MPPIAVLGPLASERPLALPRRRSTEVPPSARRLWRTLESTMGKTELVEGLFPIPHNPQAPAGLAALLSLVVPGLGQLLLGQWFKAVWVFTGSMMLCFGFGLCNVLAALDAHHVGKRIQQHEVDRGYASLWLKVPATVIGWVRSWWRKRFSLQALNDSSLFH